MKNTIEETIRNDQSPNPSALLSDVPLDKNTYIIFSTIKNLNDLIEYYSLRFSIWKELGYITDHKASSQLDIDEYDKRSIPLAGYEIGPKNKQLAVISRIITPYTQEPYASLTRKIVESSSDKSLQNTFEKKIEYQTPFIEMCTKKGRYSSFKKFLEKNNWKKYVEFSRLITNPKFKGNMLSRKMTLFHNIYALNLGADIGIAMCNESHVKYNLSYGFTGMIEGIDSFHGVRVPRKGKAIYVDLQKFNENIMIR